MYGLCHVAEECETIFPLFPQFKSTTNFDSNIPLFFERGIFNSTKVNLSKIDVGLQEGDNFFNLSIFGTYLF